MVLPQAPCPFQNGIRPLTIGDRFRRWKSSKTCIPIECQATPSIGTMSSSRVLALQRAAKADRPDGIRMEMGGHDPASPIAEAFINYHNHVVNWMVPIVFMCGYMARFYFQR